MAREVSVIKKKKLRSLRAFGSSLFYSLTFRVRSEFAPFTK
jgi:hypothetical protein